jgi:hypothetical protein
MDTTILVSTVSLSHVNSLPETSAIYRSSTSRSNVALECFFFRAHGQATQNMAKARWGADIAGIDRR